MKGRLCAPRHTVTDSDESLWMGRVNDLGLPILTIPIFIASAIAIGWLTISTQTVSIMGAYLTFGLCGMMITSKLDRSAALIYGTVYCANVLTALMIYYVYLHNYGTPYYYGGSDDQVFEAFARQAAMLLKPWEYASIRTAITGPYYQPTGYVYFVSLLYRLGELWGGFHTMLPRLFNAMALSLISVMTYVIAGRNNLSKQTSVKTSLILGLLPIMSFNAAHTFRDIPMSLLSILVVYQWDRAFHSNALRTRIIAWISTAIVAGVMWQIRPTQAVLVLVFSLFAQLSITGSLGSVTPLQGYGVFLLLIGLVSLSISQGLTSWVAERTIWYTEYYTEYRLDASPGLSSYIFTAPLPISMVLRTAYGLISPLPFVGQRFEELYQGAGTLVHYFYLPYFLLGIPRVIRNQGTRLWILSFMLFYGASLLTFTSRHIVFFLPYAALVAAKGYEDYRQHVAKIAVFVLLTGAVLGVLYIALKT